MVKENETKPEPTEDSCEAEGKILRIGYPKKAYKREEYTRCPRGKSGCMEEEKIIAVKNTVIGETYVPPTCITDLGKKGKTPEEEKWLPKLEKGGLGQFFDNEKMAYDQESCVKAGIRARKFNEPYEKLSQQFIAQSNLRVNTHPDKAKEFEKCRQNALIGFDPLKNPIENKSTSQVISDVKANLTEARKIREEWKSIIDKEK
jgi:hypothetical protein